MNFSAIDSHAGKGQSDWLAQALGSQHPATGYDVWPITRGSGLVGHKANMDGAIAPGYEIKSDHCTQ